MKFDRYEIKNILTNRMDRVVGSLNGCSGDYTIETLLSLDAAISFAIAEYRRIHKEETKEQYRKKK